jgi:hypothetical protein
MTQEIQLEIDRLKKQLQNQNIPASLKEKISLKIKGLEDTVEKTEEQVQVIEKKEEKLEQKAEGDLSEAIERMEKQLKNPQIPNSLKDKIREKIEKAKADIKEVKKEQVEEKKIKEEKVAQAKQEVKETLKKVKEVIKKTSTPKEKTEEVKKAVAKSSEAVQKAKKATEESTKSTKKRTSRLTGALRELQQIINANPTLKALYKGKGVDLKRDAARQAKPVGYRFKGKHNYRIPKNLDNPNVYYEGRPDKGDAYQNKRRGVYFADGGMMADGGEIRGGIRYVKGKELEWVGIMSFDIATYGDKEAERKAYEYIQDSIKYWNGELNEDDFRVIKSGSGGYLSSWEVMRQFPKYADGGMMADGGMFEEPIAMYRPLSGKISAKATISYDVPKEEFDQFVNYVYDVYEEEGYNKSQVRVAVRKYLKDLEGEFTWGGGDSLDRERVYEYLKNPKQKGIVNPFLAKGGMMAKGGLTKEAIVRTLTSDKEQYFLQKDNDGYILYISPRGALNSTFHQKFNVEDLGNEGTRRKYRLTKMEDGGMMAKGGKVNFDSLYVKIINAVQKDLKISHSDATNWVNKKEHLIIDMIDYYGITNPKEIADAITSDYGEYYAKGGKFLESRYSKFPNSRINFDKTYYVLVNEKSGYVPLKSHNKDFVLEKYKEFKKSYSKEDNTYNVYEVNDFEFTLIGGDDFANGGMMARGGKTKGRYNEGLSWHQDHARFNKSEKYEKPLKRRRKY